MSWVDVICWVCNRDENSKVKLPPKKVASELTKGKTADKYYQLWYDLMKYSDMVRLPVNDLIVAGSFILKLKNHQYRFDGIGTQITPEIATNLGCKLSQHNELLLLQTGKMADKINDKLLFDFDRLFANDYCFGFVPPIDEQVTTLGEIYQLTNVNEQGQHFIYDANGLVFEVDLLDVLANYFNCEAPVKIYSYPIYCFGYKPPQNTVAHYMSVPIIAVDHPDFTLFYTGANRKAVDVPSLPFTDYEEIFALDLIWASDDYVNKTIERIKESGVNLILTKDKKYILITSPTQELLDNPEEWVKKYHAIKFNANDKYGTVSFLLTKMYSRYLDLLTCCL